MGGSDGDIWSWFLVVVDDECVALRSCSGSFIRVTDGAIDMCIDDDVPAAAKFTLHKCADPVDEDNKRKFEFALKPAGASDKVPRRRRHSVPRRCRRRVRRVLR